MHLLAAGFSAGFFYSSTTSATQQMESELWSIGGFSSLCWIGVCTKWVQRNADNRLRPARRAPSFLLFEEKYEAATFAAALLLVDSEWENYRTDYLVRVCRRGHSNTTHGFEIQNLRISCKFENLYRWHDRSFEFSIHQL